VFKRVRRPDVTCPYCGAKDQKEIMYGLPTHEAFVDAEEGKIVLGGCVISNESPRWHCPNCGRDHGELANE